MVRVISFLVLVSVSIASTPAWADDGYDYRNPPTQNSMNYTKLVNLIREKKIRSIDALLSELPAEFMEKYTLIPYSDSTQGSSPKNPRVIVYGENAKFMLAFNGDTTQEGFNRLEIIEYDENTKSFSPKEIIFGPNRQDWKKQNLGKMTLVRPGVYERKSPENCKQCHGKGDFHPIWEAYRAWPSAYAGLDDEVAKGSKEWKNLEDFKKNAKDHSRYKSLKKLNVRYGYMKDYDEKTLNIYDHLDPTGKTTSQLPANNELSEYLSLLNWERIYDRIKKSPDYDSFRYAIYGALRGCDNIDKLLPHGVNSFQVPRRSLQDFQLEMNLIPQKLRKITVEEFKRTERGTPEEVEKMFGYEFTMANGFIKEDPNLDPSLGILSRLRYIFENRGISLEDWSLSGFPDVYTFANPRDNKGWRSFLRVWHQKEPEFEKFRNESHSNELCGALEKLNQLKNPLNEECSPPDH